MPEKDRRNRSAAQKLLESDIDSGDVNALKPEALHACRKEYKLFPLQVFRDHIQQAKRTRKYDAFWAAKKPMRKFIQSFLHFLVFVVCVELLNYRL